MNASDVFLRCYRSDLGVSSTGSKLSVWILELKAGRCCLFVEYHSEL